MPVRGVPDRVHRDQLERCLTHQMCGDREPVARCGLVERVEMWVAERDSTSLRRHQHLGHVGMSRPALDFTRRLLGVCALTLIDPRQRPCALCLSSHTSASQSL